MTQIIIKQYMVVHPRLHNKTSTSHTKNENSYPQNFSQGYTSDQWIGPNHDQLNERTGSKQKVTGI